MANVANASNSSASADEQLSRRLLSLLGAVPAPPPSGATSASASAGADAAATPGRASRQAAEPRPSPRPAPGSAGHGASPPARHVTFELADDQSEEAVALRHLERMRAGKRAGP